MGRIVMVTSNANCTFNETVYRRLNYKIKVKYSDEDYCLLISEKWKYDCENKY